MSRQSPSRGYSLAAVVAALPSSCNQPGSGYPPFARAVTRVPRHHLLSQDLFADVLARQRKRADRYEEAFVLLLVDSRFGSSRRLSAGVRNAILNAGLTDAVFGWHSATTLGVVLPDAPGEHWRSIVRSAVAGRVDPGTLARLSIRTYRFAPGAHAPTGPEGVRELRPPVAAFHKEQSRGYRMKRPLDLAGSAVLLLLLVPVLFFVAVLVKLTSPGPVLFRQTRVGQGGRHFTMLKFRTMRVDADEALHHEFVTRFIRSSADMDRDGRAVFKITNDPRVTPIGRCLRETSLDELPQFWNVLRGDMSLVGPRPPLPYEVEHYRAWHWHRVLHAKPGLTGLWQVVGRSRTTFDEMVRLDLRYARTCSLRTDLGILLATPAAVVSRSGAA